MRRWPLLLLLLCAAGAGAALRAPFETADVVPVRTRGRGSGRLRKRSQEQPSFLLSAFGRVMTLNLVPDSSFLAPSFSTRRIRASGAAGVPTPANQTEERLRGCFYSGTVDAERDSLVAVSLCSGIFGSFLTGGAEYLIQPKVRGAPRPDAAEQPHVLRRRSGAGSRRRLPLLFDREAAAAADARREPRTRRFVSAPRFIETLVVADASMAHFYGDDIEHYVLTLVSVAAQLFRHPSIRNRVGLALVKVLVVEDEEAGPRGSGNGGVALRNFCSWQQLFNPASQRHPEHYDTAVLFTREDICGPKSCDTLGVADVGTMCDPKRSCSVIEDNGLQAAFTAAHELGHVLSMPHDDSKPCEELFGPLGGHHLMAPVLLGLNRTAPWSPCSALYVTEFFDNGHGDCLLDAPHSAVALPAGLPGATYSLDQQCQQVFGEEFAHCPNVTDGAACSQLWCREDGTPRCSTRAGSLPWADGTPCGPGGTCLHGACAPTREVTRPLVAVDGGWSPWGAWGRCSRTCGGGVEFSYRECADPEPRNGGQYCEGQRARYRSCNTQACPGHSAKSFREEQCEKHNGPAHLDHRGHRKEWIPKYAGVSPRDRCKLFCRARGSSEFKVFDSKVIDGTVCGPDTTSVCVQGQCVKAGCDQVIGSNVRVDKCGECGGTGLSCRKITGQYNKASYGYSDIITIPAGATNIDVKQRSHRGLQHDGNYLAVKSERGGYILNGNYSVSTVEQDIPLPGAVLRYSGSSASLERIQSFHVLREAITIQLLTTAGAAAKVKYTFFIPRDMTFSKSREGAASSPSLHVIRPFGVPDWVLGEWSECSKSCGSGWSRRNVECQDAAGFFSTRCDPGLKPADIKACGDLPCPLWQTGPWSACLPACGAGQRRRGVFCVDYTGTPVEPEKCDPKKRPQAVSAECHTGECL